MSKPIKLILGASIAAALIVWAIAQRPKVASRGPQPADKEWAIVGEVTQRDEYLVHWVTPHKKVTVSVINLKNVNVLMDTFIVHFETKTGEIQNNSFWSGKGRNPLICPTNISKMPLLETAKIGGRFRFIFESPTCDYGAVVAKQFKLVDVRPLAGSD